MHRYIYNCICIVKYNTCCFIIMISQYYFVISILFFPISICAMPHAMIFIRRQKIMNSRVGNDSKIIIKWEWEKSVTRSFKGLWRNLVSLYKGNLICIILNWSYALHIRAILLIEDKIVLLLSIGNLMASVYCRLLIFGNRCIRYFNGQNIKQR